MNFTANCEINLISITILAIILFGNRKAIYNNDRKFFFGLLSIFAMFVSLFDLLAAMFRGTDYFSIKVLLYIFNALSLASISVVGYLWLLYSYTILNNKLPSMKFKLITLVPIIAMIVLIFITPINGWIFTIDSENLYVRGKYIFIHWIITYPYLIIPTIYASIKAFKEHGKNRDTIAIILFVLAPLFTSILQVLFYGITGISVGIAIACMIIYLMIQNQQIHLDSLTGVYNRAGLNRKLEDLFKSSKDKYLYAILIDIDNFKEINDKYGHIKGDTCLALVADALKKTNYEVEEEIFISRYGGDEFVILGLNASSVACNEMERLIRTEINSINEVNGFVEEIGVSIGSASGKIYDFEDPEELLQLADEKMFIEKEIHHKHKKYNRDLKVHDKNNKKIKNNNFITHRLDVKVDELNKSVLGLWLVIIIVLAITYLIEVLKDARSIEYYFIFLAIIIIPWIVCYIIYKKKPNSILLRYLAPTGFMIMYVFVMFTGSTNLVFSYILVFMALLVLYHQPSLVAGYGIVSILANLGFILMKYLNGEINTSNSKDFEIQIALLSLCFIGGYVATKLYGRVTKANQVYIEDLHQSNENIKNIAIESIITIANTIDAKDEYTRGHSQRVAIYSKMVAKELGLSEEEISSIYSIGLLHDIGKIGIPDSILNKPGRLTSDEYKVLQNHTLVGAEILKDFESIQGIDIGTKYHHERYDGLGYPEGLKGNDIPIISRIIAVADSFDAMTSDRVYRPRLTKEQVIQELKNGLGTQFDPEVGKIILKFYEDNVIPISLDEISIDK